MKLPSRSVVAAATLLLPAAVGSQEVAPLFEQAPMVSYETYTAVDQRRFTEYFQMLADKYKGTETHGWGLYRENATRWYRITALPEGMDTFVDVQAARQAGFQEFGDADIELWMDSWGTRHLSLWTAAPEMSVVPDGFGVPDIQQLPYNRVMVYFLWWNQAPAFRQALADRSALDREAGIESFVLTAWNGGLGTTTQVVMIRVSAESRAADAGPNQQARAAARESYREEWNRLTEVMNAAAYRVDRHDQQRVNRLSHSPPN